MKHTRLQTTLTYSAIGISIGLFVSILISLIWSSDYSPLNPHSPVGIWLSQQKIHGALVLLYCLVIWAIIGLLFGYGNSLFKRGWSPLRATLTHYALMLGGFLPLAALAGWMPAGAISHFLISMGLEFSLIYLIIWTLSYYSAKKKVADINQLLGH